MNDLILIVADTKKIVYASLGALRLKIAKELNLIDENKISSQLVALICN